MAVTETNPAVGGSRTAKNDTPASGKVASGGRSSGPPPGQVHAHPRHTRTGPHHHAAQPPLGAAGIGVQQEARIKEPAAHAALIAVAARMDRLQERIEVRAGATGAEDPAPPRRQVTYGEDSQIR
jgi:hypothetical protein